LLLVTAGLSQQQIPEPVVQTRESNARINPKMALDLLDAGNRRFMNGALISRPIRQQFQQTAKGQYPFAAILSCIDSRTPSELLFDLNNGDAFTIKVAGNVLTDEGLGSLEFGIQPQYAKVIVVMGHTDCGAVKGTIENRPAIDACRTPICDTIQPGNLIHFLRKIRPALNNVDPRIRPQTADNPAYVTAAARENVKLVIAQVVAGSSYIRNALSSGRVQSGAPCMT
jgi:carbonic anhydrase